MIPVQVKSLSISKVGFVVLLEAPGDARTLPIYIGPPEAQAILFHLNKVELPRPMTHDLFKNVLDVLEARLERVEIRDLKDGTFFADLVVEFEGQTLKVDTRPSDGIALALRCHAPIVVAEHVMAVAAVVLETPHDDQAPSAAPRPKKPQDPKTRLKDQLDKAIAEERYEDAARLRDELKTSENTN